MNKIKHLNIRSRSFQSTCLGLILPVLLSSCSVSGLYSNSEDFVRYKQSGTIVISRTVPSAQNYDVQNQLLGANSTAHNAMFAPLIGYFPPLSYLPADNETWVEIEKVSRKIIVRKGKETLKEIKGEGQIVLEPGEYYLQHKQKQPTWYASDNYFKNRKLSVPDNQSKLRYRRGALGRFAIYPTTDFAIHCAPVWSEEVGGLRVSLTDLASIYYLLPVGAPIIVK